jgi:HK97 family phage prohead protease
MEPQFLRAYVPQDVRASVASAADGTPIRFVASTDLAARDGLKIPISAWRTEEYLANPIVLVNHNFQSMPIGRTVRLEATEGTLYADIEFDQQDPEAKAIESKIRRGFVNSCSVSWDTVRIEGDTIKEANLLDISVVAVPADPRALVERQQRGLADMAHNILKAIEPDTTDLDPTTTTTTTESSTARATWDDTASQMMRLFTPFAQRPDEDRKADWNRLSREYARHGKTPPEFLSQADLDALGVDEVRGVFLEGEPEAFADVFASITTRAGAVLSQRNRSDLGDAIRLIQGVIERASKEQEKPEQTDDERALVMLQQLANGIAGVAA